MIQKKGKMKKGGGGAGKFFYSILSIFLVLFVIGFLAFTNWNLYNKRSGLASQIQGLQEETQTLEEANEGLREDVSQLFDPQYQEKVAREKLGRKKPGEEVVVVIPPPENKEEKKEEPKTFWQRFLEILRF